MWIAISRRANGMRRAGAKTGSRIDDDCERPRSGWKGFVHATRWDMDERSGSVVRIGCGRSVRGASGSRLDEGRMDRVRPVQTGSYGSCVWIVWIVGSFWIARDGDRRSRGRCGRDVGAQRRGSREERMICWMVAGSCCSKSSSVTRAGRVCCRGAEGSDRTWKRTPSKAMRSFWMRSARACK